MAAGDACHVYVVYTCAIPACWEHFFFVTAWAEGEKAVVVSEVSSLLEFLRLFLEPPRVLFLEAFQVLLIFKIQTDTALS